MIRIACRVTCDNDNCPDEAEEHTRIELTGESDEQDFLGVAHELVTDGLVLPEGWVKDGAKVYCSEACQRGEAE